MDEHEYRMNGCYHPSMNLLNRQKSKAKNSMRKFRLVVFAGIFLAGMMFGYIAGL